MPCTHCAAFRSAVLHARMAEAAGLAVDKFREVFGLEKVEKTEGVGGIVGEQGVEVIVPKKPHPKP